MGSRKDVDGDDSKARADVVGTVVIVDAVGKIVFSVS